MEHKRIYLFDNVKLLLILSVVTGHLINFYGSGTSHSVYQGIFAFIYSFHMPAFIFVSGLFHKNAKIPEKAFSFFSIAILMKIVQCIYNYFLTGATAFNPFQGSSLSWYMLALAVFNVLTYLVRNMDKRLVFILALLTGCFCGFANLGNTLSLTRVLVFFPFYFLGSALDRNRLVALSEKKPLKAVSALIIAAWAVVCYLKRRFVYKLVPLLKGKSPFSKLPANLEPYGIYLRVACYAVAFVLIFAIIFLLPNRKLPLVTVAGQRTLQVYFWHPVVLVILINAFGVADRLTQNTVGLILYLLLAIPIVALLSLKPFAYPAEWVIKYGLKNKEKAKNE